MKIPHASWVVVADAGKFLVLENIGEDDLLNLQVLAAETHENPRSRDQGTDRPGRMAAPLSPRSAVDDTDWHRLEEARAAADLAHRIEGWLLARACESLVLVADPRTLGEVRRVLSDSARKHIAAEVARDLTKLSVADIESHLTAY